MWQINVIFGLLPRSLVLSILGHLFSSRTKTHEMETERYQCTLQMFLRYVQKGHILTKDRMRAMTSKNLLDMYNSINTHGLNLLSKGEKYLRYETHSIWWMMFEIKTNSFVCFTTCLSVNSTCVQHSQHNASNNVKFASCWIPSAPSDALSIKYHAVQRKIDTDKKFTKIPVN